MGTSKADAILFVGFFLECEMCREPIIETETDDIADSIGNAFVHER
jgi:hypothetical protein